MLKIIATVNNRRTLFIGLERKNTERLLVDMPIAFDLQALVSQAPAGERDVQDVVLLGGETLADVYAQLKAGIPSLPPFKEPTPE